MSSDFTETLTSVVDQEAITIGCHEIGITVDIIGSIQPREDLIKEVLDLLGATARLKFGNPDRAAGGNFTCFLDVVLEVCGIRRIIVPNAILAQAHRGKVMV